MLSLYTSSTVLSATSRPSFVWSAKHGVRFVLPAVKPTLRLVATPSLIVAPVPAAAKRKLSFFSRQSSSVVRPSRLTSSVATPLRVLVVRRKTSTVTVESTSPSSAVVAIDFASTPSNSSSQLVPTTEPVTFPSVSAQATVDADEQFIAPHSVETTPSTRRENAQPALSSFSDLAFLYGYALPLTVVAHTISSLTPVPVEPEQLNTILRKLPFL